MGVSMKSAVAAVVFGAAVVGSAFAVQLYSSPQAATVAAGPRSEVPESGPEAPDGGLVLHRTGGGYVVITPVTEVAGDVLVFLSPYAPDGLRAALERQLASASGSARFVEVSSPEDVVSLGETATALIVDAPSFAALGDQWLVDHFRNGTMGLILLNGTQLEIQRRLSLTGDEEAVWSDSDPGREGNTDYYFSAHVLGYLCDNRTVGSFALDAPEERLLRALRDLAFCQQPVPGA